MDTSTALRFLSSVLLSLPIISVVFLLLQLGIRAALSFVLLRTLELPPNLSTTTSTLSTHHHHGKSRQYAKLKIALYAGEHGVECAVCLNDVAHGNEVRDLKCKHFFHKGCLDGWVDHGWSTCPLCREALVAEEKSETTRSDGYDDDDEDEDEMSPSGLLYMVCLGSGGW